MAENKGKIKLLFVCHGNICRSPMAEFIFKDLIKKEGFGSQFIVESAAVSREEIGNPVYPPAKQILAQHGISCKGKTAVQIKPSDYEKYDFIIPMEEYNITRMKNIIPKDPQNKIKLLLDFSDKHGNIDDPWYSGDFDKTYEEILLGCQGILKYFKIKNLL